MSTPDYERARSALRFVSPDDRETWVRMGMALKDGFGDEGFDLWDGWSRQSDRYVERDARDVWKSIKRDGGITLSTLFREAKVNGWRDDGARPTPEELEARRRESAKWTARQKAEETREHAQAASKAAQIWEGASTRADKHAYLIRKRVKAYGLRVHDGSLVVPVRNGDELRSLQYIAPDGIKKFFNGGSVSGCYFNIGDLNGVVALCICEGFATGASIHEATGLPVAVAFNAGNLLPAAKAIRERLPELHLIVCADDDARTPGNPGLTKATAAADAVGGTVAVPDFGENRPEAATDFNDLHRHAGLEAVAACIAAVATGEDRGRNGAGKAAGNREAEGIAVQDPQWPHPMDPRAYYGVAGEMVKAIGPHTESDPAALLVQILVAFGAFVGRTPYVQVEGDRHYSNLFALLIGITSRGRKGTSWGRVRSIFERILGWLRVASGLSSGEGLKWQVRDPVTKLVKNKESGTMEEVIDEGVQDKRLLVIEPEFAAVTRVVARQGNNLTSTIREAWDIGNLSTLTRHDPITATGAHIAIIGHVTADELRAELTHTDTANGFANRFLFLCVKRSKCLPFGGEDLPESVVTDFARRLEKAGSGARRVGRVKMTEAARGAREGYLIVGRRGGKSFIAALIGVFLAAFRTYKLSPGERGVIMMIAADRRQAKVLFRYSRAFIEGVPMLKAMVERETADAIELSNGITLEVHTASFKSVRGYTIVAALCDETSFWDTEDSANPDTEILNALRPAMATVPDALLLCLSTPYSRRGALWNAYQRHFGKPGDSLVWQAATTVMNPLVPAAVIDAAYEEDPAAASAEYGAEFRSDCEAFVTAEAVDACVVHGRLELPPVPGVHYVAFTDPSGGSQDSMTLAIGHSESEHAVLDLIRERKPPFSPENVVQEFAETLKTYGLHETTGDRYGGLWPAERFITHGIHYKIADKTKSEIYQAALPALNSRRVELLDSKRLRQQLVGLERRTSRGGRDSIDHRPGGHDDVVNAAAGVLTLCVPTVPITPDSFARGTISFGRPGNEEQRILWGQLQ